MTDSFDNSWRPLSAELSLQRSGLHDLNLTIGSRNTCSSYRMKGLKDVTKHLARSRTLNVHSESLWEIREILDLVFRHCVPEHMSQLSLRFLSKDEEPDHRTSEQDVFNHMDSPLRPYLIRALHSLSSLRISNICLEWEPAMFSARLVELRVDTIRFAGDSAVTAFLTALSSAEELRDLKVISVEAFADQGSVLPQGSRISLPKLQSLYLEDLYFNFTNALPMSITPGSHRMTFNPSFKTTLNLLASSADPVAFGDTCLEHTIWPSQPTPINADP
ncbi:hypothetical protein RSAG8_12118, partial [Rhizoctonia solani AG-8 WAC10335]